jgi:hypothetical protein
MVESNASQTAAATGHVKIYKENEGFGKRTAAETRDPKECGVVDEYGQTFRHMATRKSNFGIFV